MISFWLCLAFVFAMGYVQVTHDQCTTVSTTKNCPITAAATGGTCGGSHTCYLAC
ncbi:hypothetical protein FOXB_05303 [Fusarium oxysporum f. sp. conglutinans Fo5176]|uniref:Uncharacterized protein n=1 Tax=Fusarium oxysporum (strain Fo5176) TaxID=660025 RepID=F9FFX4_FUSOF|nr:hypothetical protein FOXB_05303 [Fusarium oxysporum f. sp. conglutinans Fo5176]